MRTVIIALVSILVPMAQAVAAPGKQRSAATELRRSTQSLLDAIAPGDVAVWDHFLAENAIQVDENDVVR
jgi:hypothetical protein